MHSIRFSVDGVKYKCETGKVGVCRKESEDNSVGEVISRFNCGTLLYY